ncbi:MAG: hypothetical protein COU08_04550 [Candidatus Harrisonbacteria bacterium CG10_big_fil_rev_8_21_14_0_10_42_17]|uniref:Uncharacterized protein n=1 Tax=Candidatus Harrisonbacteria bacterium CG10_big_fil_rev_8_21_14_0_10_42_17 TaxID=1974584 RepID=A0A2M6WH25_9BACT|nr:MAG: hypothetical protein COU08_04550 [Candidatus Harrisonbacteria bacterium CG10_big_fil_rev_8_21_14_0_10_42_17]
MNYKKKSGQILVQALIVSALAAIIIPLLVHLALTNLASSKNVFSNEVAFQVAEAGIEYYRWHLAHAPEDFQDGTGAPGPYLHPYSDKEGNVIGEFQLEITPPPIGSTVVEIVSTGVVNNNPQAIRKIRTQLAIPSLAKYAVVVDDNIRFGEGTEVFGPIHSNKGIRFDGLAHGVVSSAVAEYNDPDHSGGVEFGVHTHVDPVDPQPPVVVPTRNDVFLAGRQFPVPAVDFTGLIADLAQIKSDAQISGLYFGSSSGFGYHIVLKPDDTFDVYEVDALIPKPNGCISVLGQQGWGTWSIQDETMLQTYTFPANGLLFFEDDLWVDGHINTARITIAAGRFPDTPGQRKNITVNDNLLYTNYDGQDVIALIAQENVNAGMISADFLRIDGALIAQKGRVGRYYYRPPTQNQERCDPYHVRDTITLYGMVGTAERYGFAYSDGTGYQNRNIIYDTHLLFSPPPSFPLTSDEYETILWEEVR